jgi:hypothetical protein
MANVLLFHWYEVFRIVKFREKQLTKRLEKGNMELLFNGDRVSVGDDDKVLEICHSDGAQQYE